MRRCNGILFCFIFVILGCNGSSISQIADVGGRLMTGILGMQGASIDIKRSLVFLESYVLRYRRNDYKNLKLKEEIEFDGGLARRFIAIDTIEKLANNNYAIEITLAKELTSLTE